MFQQVGERNFHAFYYLLHGLAEADLAVLGLKPSDLSNYSYINQGGAQIKNQTDDKQNFKLVSDAMKIASFEPEFIKTIWNIIAAIIHLGNIEFESNEKDSNNNNQSSGEAKIANNSSQSIRHISRLLQVNENDLKSALTSRLLATGHKDIVTTFHSTKEALYAKDAFAKVGFIW